MMSCTAYREVELPQGSVSKRGFKSQWILKRGVSNSNPAAYVASVSVRFKSKERGTRNKDRAKNGASKTENPLPRSLFAPKPNGKACRAGYQSCC